MSISDNGNPKLPTLEEQMAAAREASQDDDESDLAFRQDDDATDWEPIDDDGQNN